jgi:uncharacterized membrane protein YebE (DUF533 family)
MKERFTPEEWSQLLTVPVQAFIMVAGADGQIDDKETEEFSKRVALGGAGYRDPLHREVARDLAVDFATAWDHAVKTDPGTVKAFMRAKLTPVEYQGFLGSVFIDCLAIANATGKKRLFHKKAKIGEEEQALLGLLATVWEIDPQAIQSIFS